MGLNSTDKLVEGDVVAVRGGQKHHGGDNNGAMFVDRGGEGGEDAGHWTKPSRFGGCKMYFQTPLPMISPRHTPKLVSKLQGFSNLPVLPQLKLAFHLYSQLSMI